MISADSLGIVLTYADFRDHLAFLRAFPRLSAPRILAPSAEYVSRHLHEYPARIIRDLLATSRRINPSVRRNLAIRTAAKRGLAGTVAALLADPRVDPSEGANLALCSAVCEGHVSVAALLLSDPRVLPPPVTLEVAAEMEDPEMAALLLSDPGMCPGKFALYAASQTPSPDVLRLLLDDGRLDPSNSDCTGPASCMSCVMSDVYLDYDDASPPCRNLALKLARQQDLAEHVRLLESDPRVN